MSLSTVIRRRTGTPAHRKQHSPNPEARRVNGRSSGLYLPTTRPAFGRTIAIGNENKSLCPGQFAEPGVEVGFGLLLAAGFELLDRSVENEPAVVDEQDAGGDRLDFL